MPPPYQWKLVNDHKEYFIKENSNKYVLDTTCLNVKFEKKWMLCHLLGRVLTNYWKQKETCTLANAAYICSKDKDWGTVKDLYKHAYVKPQKILSRWKNMNDEKYHFLIWLKCFLCKKISIKDFIAGLYSFHCVHLYILDMQWYQFAKHWVYQELFEQIDMNLTQQWNISIVIIGILHEMYNIDVIQVGHDYEKLNLNGYIYDRVCRGLLKMPL